MLGILVKAKGSATQAVRRGRQFAPKVHQRAALQIEIALLRDREEYLAEFLYTVFSQNVNVRHIGRF